MAHEVFISYSSQDKPIADAVCATLESQGVRCWVAPRDILPGKEWGQAIVEGITDAQVMVVLFSEHSNASHQVMREVERAVNAGLAVLPFRIQDVQPSGSLEYFLSSTHWLDALTKPIEQHIHRLGDTINTLLEREDEIPQAAKPEKKTLPPAPQPQKRVLPGWLLLASGAALLVLFAVVFLWPSGNDPGRGIGSNKVEVAESGQRMVPVGLIETAAAEQAAVRFLAVMTNKAEPVTDRVRWILYDKEGNRVKSSSGSREIELEPGDYLVEAKLDGAVGWGEFKAFDDAITTYGINLMAGRVRLSTTLAAGGPPEANDLHWRVFEPAPEQSERSEEVVSAYDDQPSLVLAEGEYDIMVSKGSASAEKRISVKAGETTEAALVLNAGWIKARALLSKDGPVVTSDLRWQVYPLGDDTQVATSSDATPMLLLPKGEYRITLKHDAATAETTTAVDAGGTVERSLVLNAGVLRSMALVEENGPPITEVISWRVLKPAVSETSRPEQVARSNDAQPSFILNEGTYDLEVEHGSVSETKGIQITPAQVTEETFVLNIGVLEVAVVRADGLAEFEKKPACEILTSDADFFGKRERLDHFYGTSYRNSFGKGSYLITCESGDFTGEAPAAITAGEVLSLQVTLSSR